VSNFLKFLDDQLKEDSNNIYQLEIVQLLNKSNIQAMMNHLDKIAGDENKGRVQEVRSFLKLLQNNVDNLTSIDSIKDK
jgi:hypothetical protein